MPTVPVTAECIVQASQAQGVPIPIILGLLKVEGGRVGSESLNRNGSRDLGPMQINDRVWVPTLAKLAFNGNEGQTWLALRDHGCLNIHVGAWIYRQQLDAARGNHAEAIGTYHSRTPDKKAAYQQRFAEHFARLFGGVARQAGQQQGR